MTDGERAGWTRTSAPGEPLRVERSPQGVVLLTFDLPERRNAMTDALTAAWTREVAVLAGDRELRCVVVTGEGSAFCAGGDVGWIGSEPDNPVEALRDRMIAFYRSWLVIRDLEVPTVAAINGPAVGAGLALALACDLRYATPAARLSVPFTRLGMHPGMAATALLPEVVGLPAARELFFTGRAVRGDEAQALGLVNRVFPADSLLDEVLGVAGDIAAAAPVATRLTKVALADGGHASYAQSLEWEALAQGVTLATSDLQEGLRARAEKRTPRFEGR